jgi:6,7-dimethyl-8-ribityllumazine synthase
MGTEVQARRLDVERDYLGRENCTEILCETRPDIVRDIHRAYLEAGADAVDVFQVPGAFELPLAAKRLSKTYHAIIALGAVIRGETPHFEYVAAEAARGLQQVALENDVPVAFGVLTTDTYEQAAARAGGANGNKGYDAAMTAVEMARFPAKR